MTTTKFTDTTATQQGTVVFASWLNDVDSATYSTLSAVAGTANAITAVGPLSLTSFNSSSRFVFNPQTTNTGGATINISSLGNKAVLKYGTTPLVAGDLVAGTLAEIFYDGTNFQLQNPQASVPTGTVIPVSQGGTGSTTAAAARTALNVAAIGPTFNAYLSATQTGVPNTTSTLVTLNTTLFDTTTAFNTTTNRFVPQVAGYYLITAQVQFVAASNDNVNCQLYIRKNGANYSIGIVAGTVAQNQVVAASTVVFLNGSTDYVDLAALMGTTASARSFSGGSGATFLTGYFLHP